LYKDEANSLFGNNIFSNLFFLTIIGSYHLSESKITPPPPYFKRGKRNGREEKKGRGGRRKIRE